jgi:hypothetical protein
MLRLLAMVAVLPIFAADDAAEIVKRFVAAENRNASRASQYTFVEQAEHFSVEKDGSAKKDHSETYEVMFVEGQSYKKLIARDDRPLDAKEQAKVDKALQKAGEDRRKQRRSGLLHKNVSLGTPDDLLTMFDNRIAGEEEVRGHKAWVIECVPKPDRVPANGHEKEVLSFRRKFWINQADDAIVREVSTVVGEHIFFTPGSTITWDFEKINDDAWLTISGVLDGHLQFAKFIKPGVRTEYRYSKFQKFDVQSTISVDPSR